MSVPIDQLPLSHLHSDSLDSCSYCKGKNTTSSRGWSTAGFVCNKMSPLLYQILMERGWRRCGTYYYKANMDRCCCRPYTIKLDVSEYKARKSHRKLMKKFMYFFENIKDQKLNDIKMEKEQIIEEKQCAKKNKKINEKKNMHDDPPILSKNEMNTEQEKIHFDHFQFLKSLEEIVRQKIVKFTNENNENIIRLCLNDFDNSNAVEFNVFDYKNLKFLRSVSPKYPNSFTTNFLPILFSNLKNIISLKLGDFVVKLKDFYLNFLDELFRSIKISEHPVIISISESGIINFELILKSQKPQNEQNMEIEKKQKQLKKELPSKQRHKESQIDVGSLIKNEKEESKESPNKIFELKENQKNVNSFPDIPGLVIKLEKAKFEKESYEIYKRYCKIIHKSEKESENGYTNFLCSQALDYQLIKTKEGKALFCGCYHMKYYFNDKLFAVGVIDLVPQGLSSVYYFYDPLPEYKKLGLGVIGGLKEIDYIANLRKSIEDFKYYYLGFYIQSCQKMVYKGEFGPPQLLCPKSYRWVYLDEKIRKLIDKDEADSKLCDESLINEMNISKEEKEKIIKEQIKIQIKKGVYRISELMSPYDETFKGIFTELIEWWGKDVCGKLTFTV